MLNCEEYTLDDYTIGQLEDLNEDTCSMIVDIMKEMLMEQNMCEINGYELQCAIENFLNEYDNQRLSDGLGDDEDDY